MLELRTRKTLYLMTIVRLNDLVYDSKHYQLDIVSPYHHVTYISINKTFNNKCSEFIDCKWPPQCRHTVTPSRGPSYSPPPASSLSRSWRPSPCSRVSVGTACLTLTSCQKFQIKFLRWFSIFVHRNKMSVVIQSAVELFLVAKVYTSTYKACRQHSVLPQASCIDV